MLSRHFLRIPRLSRGLATHAGTLNALPATLHLKTGQSFHGRSFGAQKSIFGETVFSTSITSCTWLPLNEPDTQSRTSYS
jgi:carbamoyl-phosphate synthase small subunit